MQPGAIPSKQTKDPAALPPRGLFRIVVDFAVIPIIA